jgi:hypothetical protein
LYGLTGSNRLVWGQVAGYTGAQGGDEIIWGTKLQSQGGDEIIWGTSGGDEIIWGTTSDGSVLTRGEN